MPSALSGSRHIALEVITHQLFATNKFKNLTQYVFLFPLYCPAIVRTFLQNTVSRTRNFGIFCTLAYFTHTSMINSIPKHYDNQQSM